MNTRHLIETGIGCLVLLGLAMLAFDFLFGLPCMTAELLSR